MRKLTTGSTEWISARELPVDLVAVAAFDDLDLELFYRGGRPNPKPQHTRKLLRKAYPYIKDDEISQLMKASKSKDWQIFLADFDKIQLQTRNKGAPILVSTTFPHISKRMACYWRKHEKYKIARRLVERYLGLADSNE